MQNNQKRYLEAGQIVAPHGIAGEVRVQPWCDGAEFLCSFDILYFDHGKSPIVIENARPHKNIAILKLAGVNSRDDALGLRSKVLYLDREEIELPQGCYFVQDLIGLEVVDADLPNRRYGELIDVTQTGANDVYHIRDEAGKVTLIPAIPDVIVHTDIPAGQMRIRPLKGLFDDED